MCSQSFGLPIFASWECCLHRGHQTLALTPPPTPMPAPSVRPSHLQCLKRSGPLDLVQLAWWLIWIKHLDQAGTFCVLRAQLSDAQCGQSCKRNPNRLRNQCQSMPKDRRILQNKINLNAELGESPSALVPRWMRIEHGMPLACAVAPVEGCRCLQWSDASQQWQM